MRSKTHSKLFAIAVLLGTPGFCIASVRITEVMYDLPGADAGREWVEVINDGGDVDLKDYKFFNKDGGHLLKAYGSGSSLLSSGGVAVIADKPDMFMSDNPSYAGILIDSSFSLVSSDTVGVKDLDGNIVDSVVYANSMGANGDGNSLQRGSGDGLAPATPTPGLAPSDSSTSSSSQTNSSSETSTSTTSSSSSSSSSSASKPDVPIKNITVDAGGDRTVTVGASSVFTAKVYGIAGEPIPNPRIVWNFGNGESREGVSVSFAYGYPGGYNLVVSGASGEYSALDRVSVEALSADVVLIPETNGTVVLFNKEKRDLDVSLWYLARSGKTFLIPAHTVISGGGKVPFAKETTGLPESGEVALLYPNGASAVGSVVESTSGTSDSQSIVSTIGKVIHRASVGGNSNVAAAAGSISAKTSSAESTNSKGDEWMLWLAGALGIGVLGAVGVVFLRRGQQAESGSSALSKIADTYEIIE